MTRTCNASGCTEIPDYGAAYCPLHRSVADRLVSDALSRPQPRPAPEWLRRRQAALLSRGLVADKDLTAA